MSCLAFLAAVSCHCDKLGLRGSPCTVNRPALFWDCNDSNVVIVTPPRRVTARCHQRCEPAVVACPPMSSTIDVTVNGEARHCAEGTTITALLAELGLADRRVAVERTREIIPRARHAETILDSGDRLELVTFVGGG